MAGALISSIGNKDLTWEKTYTLGVGVDAAFFQNRLRVNWDWYNKRTDNILFNVPITGLDDMENSIRLMEKGKTSLEGPGYASKEAAWALLSRICLYMSGTYENPNAEYAQKAVDYATKVIDSGKYQLLSREDFMVYNTFTPENNDESIFVVKRMASEKPDSWNSVGGMYS